MMSSEEISPVASPVPRSVRTLRHAVSLPVLLTVDDVMLALLLSRSRVKALAKAGAFPGAFLQDRWPRLSPTGAAWRRRAYRIPHSGLMAYLDAKRKNKHA